MADFKLRDALLNVANRVQREGTKFPENDKMWKANSAAMTMFASNTPMYRTVDGRRTNIRLFALLRVQRYMHQQGIDWSKFTWDDIVQWFYDNWETILKVLLSLLVFI